MTHPDYRPHRNLMLNRLYQHHSGRFYRPTLVANGLTSRPHKFPVTVVYQGTNGLVWARPLDEFVEKMTLVEWPSAWEQQGSRFVRYWDADKKDEAVDPSGIVWSPRGEGGQSFVIGETGCDFGVATYEQQVRADLLLRHFLGSVGVQG